MRRIWIPAVLAALALSACGRSSTDTAAASTTSTTPPWTTDPEAPRWRPIIELCAAANDAALADADRLLPVDSTAVPQHLAQYYRHRADQVQALATELRALTPPDAVADKWPGVLDGLDAYATWARSAADAVEREGLEADQTPAPGLDDFRTLMTYGACHDLLGVN